MKQSLGLVSLVVRDYDEASHAMLGWVTRKGHVRGWLGTKSVELTIVRTAGGVWTMNDAEGPGAHALP